ncbi:MFS transporter, partial [Candidatus Thorarchaeota archaeon]
MTERESSQSGEQIHLDREKSLSWLESVRTLLSNKNFTVFLLTGWIYSSFNVIQRYLQFYFRDIGIGYFEIGVLFSVFSAWVLVGQLIAGYLADNTDRKHLAWITMASNGFGYIILSLAYDIWTVVFGFLTIALSTFTGKGGTAYIMEQMERRVAGVGISIFQFGTALGLLPLFVMTLLFDSGWAFVPIMRVMLLLAGIGYLACTLIRIIALESSPPTRSSKREESYIRDFINETVRGTKLLLRILPVFVLVSTIDAFSDSFYRYGSSFYINESLRFQLGDINLMLLITLVVSVPLTLVLGRS